MIPPDTVQFRLQLDEKLHRALKILSAKTGRCMNAIALDGIQKEVSRLEKQEAKKA